MTRAAARLVPLALASMLALTACSSGATQSGGTASGSGDGTITVTDNNGQVQVPTNPARVVALDNTSFETLHAMGVKPVAVPKRLLPNSMQAWNDDPEILDVGTHTEPKLEVINEAAPDLIVGGKRFLRHTDTLKTIAPVIDLAPNVEQSGYLDKLKNQTTALGQIFGQEEMATQLGQELDTASQAAAQSTTGQSVFLANHNGGKIDNGAGRMAPLIQPLGMTDVFAATDEPTGGSATPGSESVHQDSGLAPETIAAVDPDWMIVMDRDAATAEPGETVTAAKATVDAQRAWANTTFMQRNQVVYLEPDFYTTEGIQAYTRAYQAINTTASQ